MKIDAWRCGMKLGFFVTKLRSNFYWLFPKLRQRKHDKEVKAHFVFIKKFVKSLIMNSSLRLVMCESCRAIGIDYQSEKHGWKYEGYHIWTCPKCKEKS